MSTKWPKEKYSLWSAEDKARYVAYKKELAARHETEDKKVADDKQAKQAKLKAELEALGATPELLALFAEAVAPAKRISSIGERDTYLNKLFGTDFPEPGTKAKHFYVLYRGPNGERANAKEVESESFAQFEKRVGKIRIIKNTIYDMVFHLKKKGYDIVNDEASETVTFNAYPVV